MTAAPTYPNKVNRILIAIYYPLSRRIGSEKLTFLPDFKCRSEGLRFRAERRSRRKQTKTAFRSVYTKRLSGQAGARNKDARCAKANGPNRREGLQIAHFQMRGQGSLPKRK